jgi:predicted NAD-dependent protein-ADP-ribosyltransferase YbiA (DUF1768 family)
MTEVDPCAILVFDQVSSDRFGRPDCQESKQPVDAVRFNSKMVTAHTYLSNMYPWCNHAQMGVDELGISPRTDLIKEWGDSKITGQSMQTPWPPPFSNRRHTHTHTHAHPKHTRTNTSPADPRHFLLTWMGVKYDSSERLYQRLKLEEVVGDLEYAARILTGSRRTSPFESKTHGGKGTYLEHSIGCLKALDLIGRKKGSFTQKAVKDAIAKRVSNRAGLDRSIMELAVSLKFKQNPDLLRALRTTGSKRLGESSHRRSRWSITGGNWLGQILESVRDNEGYMHTIIEFWTKKSVAAQLQASLLPVWRHLANSVSSSVSTKRKR